MTGQPSSDVWLELGSSTVYEASGQPCALDPALRPAWPGARVSGPAFPVLCAVGDNLALHLAVETAPPGSVLVVSTTAPGASARLLGYWGEVLSWAAISRGIAGLVIDEGVRDVDKLETMGFPVFARGISMAGTAKAVVGSVGAPIQIGGVVVSSGDLVVADRDGVLSLPAALVERVLAAATARRAKEHDLVERVRGGARTLDLYGWRGLAGAGASTGGPVPAQDLVNRGAP